MERCDLRRHIGERVRLAKDVDNYPDVLVTEGHTGVLSQVNNDSIWVKLDKHFPELGKWDNEIQIWDWSKIEDDHPCEYIDLLPEAK